MSKFITIYLNIDRKSTTKTTAILEEWVPFIIPQIQSNVCVSNQQWAVEKGEEKNTESD